MKANPDLIFLKLGGSLITDKSTPSTAIPERISHLSSEIAEFMNAHLETQLILGHGSGSFGHVAGKKYGTRQGVRTPEEWRGFTEVWRQAKNLNQIVANALHAAGLPAIVFPAVSSAAVEDGLITHWDIAPMQKALENGLLPVVHGDVAFDSVRGGTIVSTEDIFKYLAAQLRPTRVLITGIEPGVWADYPECTRIIEKITPATLDNVLPALRGSSATDVTGGMASKVQEMLAMVESVPGLEVSIFSGLEDGSLREVLAGKISGTLISDR